MHNVDPYNWGGASVTHPDWQGTAHIDEKKTGDESIYTITGIDRDQWTIIGLDWGGGESGRDVPHAIVVPADTDLSARQIEATDLMLHDVDINDLLKRITHVADFRLRIRSVVDSEITITSLGDVPEQD